jgi:hypothetical protein
VPLLQVQEVTQHPLHHRFLPCLEQLAGMFSICDQATDVGQLVLAPDFLLTLQRWLLLLDSPSASPSLLLGGSSQTSQGGSDAADGSAQSSQGALPMLSSWQPPPTAYTNLDRFCPVLATIVNTMRMLLERASVVGIAAGTDLVLVTVEQLLSSPAALRVAIHQGLSAEVQEAARAGSTEAAHCITAVCSLFARAATDLHMRAGIVDPLGDGKKGGGRLSGELTGQLAAFLRLEENLPFLELLCLPPDHSEPHRRVLATCRRRNTARWPKFRTCCRTITAKPNRIAQGRHIACTCTYGPARWRGVARRSATGAFATVPLRVLLWHSLRGTTTAREQ